MRWIAIAAVSLAAACSGSKPNASGSGASVQRTEVRGTEEGKQTAAVAHRAPGAVLAEVRFRDHVLVIRSGAGERRFDVRSRGGAVLASSLTREQLEERFPAIGAHFRDSQAVEIDATLDTSTTEKPAPFGP